MINSHMISDTLPYLGDMFTEGKGGFQCGLSIDIYIRYNFCIVLV